MSFFVFIFVGMNLNKKKIVKWFKIALIIYVVLGTTFYFIQDYILFHPVTLKKNHKFDFSQKHRDVNLPITQTSNLNIVQFLSNDTITRGIVLYFHGNKKNIAWYAKYPPYFTQHGYEVWIIDYPGFGKSTGKFTEQNLYQWADYLYIFAKSRFQPDSIIIYGKSMGTGIATELASKNKCKRLILETPYYDFPSVVKHYLPIYPVDWMVHYKFPTYRFLKNVEAPVTIFQGTNDWIVTYNNAARLKQFLKKDDEFITLKGGKHNDLYNYPETIGKLDSLLNK